MTQQLKDQKTPGKRTAKSNGIMRFFEYDHLPMHQQLVSAPMCEVAKRYNDLIDDGPEKSAGLRKLLEAKDCMVRASLCKLK